MQDILLLAAIIVQVRDTRGDQSACREPCPDGQIYIGGCTVNHPEPICQQCPRGKYWYRPESGGPPACYFCSRCNRMDELTKKQCLWNQNTECWCKPGTYLKNKADNYCTPHTVCYPGSYVKINGTHERNRECERCLPGTFTNVTNAITCLPHTNCTALQQIYWSHGDYTKDALCGPYQGYHTTAITRIWTTPTSPHTTLDHKITTVKQTSTEIDRGGTNESGLSQQTIHKIIMIVVIALVIILICCVGAALTYVYCWKRRSSNEKEPAKENNNQCTGVQTLPMKNFAPQAKIRRRYSSTDKYSCDPREIRRLNSDPGEKLSDWQGLKSRRYMPAVIKLHQEESVGRTFARTDMTNNWAFQLIQSIKDLTRICLQLHKQRLLQSGYKIKICIVDTGINSRHVAFDGFTINYINCVADEAGATESQDTSGHGTFVAGIICEMLRDVKEFIELFIVKAVKSNDELTFQNLEKAYTLLLSEEYSDVCLVCQPNGFANNPPLDSSLRRQIKDLVEKKVLVCAASNDGQWKSDNIAWPAREAIAIGSHDEHANRSGFSPQGQFLHVLGPGNHIISANSNYDPQQRGSTMYMKGSGTSFAGPWVAALLAFVYLHVEMRYKDLAENFKRQLQTTGVAKCLLKSMATETRHQITHGYGHLQPYEKAFESDEKFKIMVDKALVDG